MLHTESRLGRLATSPWLFGIVLLGLLGVLATLQFRWTGELSRAERERAKVGLEEGLERIAGGLDRELTGLAMVFGPEGRPPFSSDEAALGVWLTKRLDLWRNWTGYPEILRGIYRVRLGPPHEERSSVGAGTPLRRFDEALPGWVDEPWPEALGGLRSRLEGATDLLPDNPGPPRFRLLDGRAPAILLPYLEGPSRRRFFEERGGGPGRPLAVEVMILYLDPEAIRDPLVLGLARQHLADPDGFLPYHLSVVDRDGGETVFELGPALGEENPRGDAEAELFGFVEPERLADLMASLGGPAPGLGLPGDRQSGDPRADRRLRDRRARRGRPGTLLSFSGGEHQWRLVASHPAGSLDQAIEHARWRNLGVSFAILGLLGLSALALLRATRRAQQLARTQSELVAGVTHELMTPLAALRSAGQNLADGVVYEEEGVRRYGQLVDHEGRRLSEMVAQMLELAGIAAGDRPFERRRIEVADWIDHALDAVGSELEQAEIEVERSLATDLPAVEGDVEALGRALRNLLGNAIKYAAGGGWIGITARRVGHHIEIEVADRGPGIPSEDLPHVFEPFRRGRAMAASAVPGSGLGLALTRSIIEAHGGRITVANRRGGGCAAVLRLPFPS